MFQQVDTNDAITGSVPQEIIDGEEDFMQHLNPESLSVLENCWVEPSLVDAKPETAFQFEREGYFLADRYDHSAGKPVFNMTIGLKASK